MDIEYSLWPIWYDYLEEQGQNTELLRYVLTWQVNSCLCYRHIDFVRNNYGCLTFTPQQSCGCFFQYFVIDIRGNFLEFGGHGTIAYNEHLI